MLTFNVEKKDRVELHRSIASRLITPQELAGMSSAELANAQQKQRIEEAAEESLKDSILEVRLAPKAKITHKGEEVIESIVEDQEMARLTRLEEEEERQAQTARARSMSDASMLTPITPKNYSSGMMGPDLLINAPIPASGNLAGTPPPLSARRLSLDADGPQSPSAWKSPVSFDQPLIASPTTEQLVIDSTSPTMPNFDINSLSWSARNNQNDDPVTLSNSPKEMDNEDGDELPMDVENAVPDAAFDIDIDDLDRDPNFDVVATNKAELQNSVPKPVDSKLARFEALSSVWDGLVR